MAFKHHKSIHTQYPSSSNLHQETDLDLSLAHYRWLSSHDAIVCWGRHGFSHKGGTSPANLVGFDLVERLKQWRMMKNGDWMEIWSCFQTDQTFFPGFDMVLRYSLGGVVPWASLLPFDLVLESHIAKNQWKNFGLCDRKNLHQNWSSLVVTRLACKPPLHKQQLCLQFWLRLQFTPSLLCKASIWCCSKALFGMLNPIFSVASCWIPALIHMLGVLLVTSQPNASQCRVKTPQLQKGGDQNGTQRGSLDVIQDEVIPGNGIW